MNQTFAINLSGKSGDIIVLKPKHSHTYNLVYELKSLIQIDNIFNTRICARAQGYYRKHH